MKRAIGTILILIAFIVAFISPAISSELEEEMHPEKVINYYSDKICDFRQHNIPQTKCHEYALNIYNYSHYGELSHITLFSLLWQESTFKNVVGDERNHFKAYGLGQLQERTAESMIGRELKDDVGPRNRHELIINYKLNIRLSYMNLMRHYTHHNNNLNLALRAYNAGRGNIHYRDAKIYASEVHEKIGYIKQELNKVSK